MSGWQQPYGEQPYQQQQPNQQGYQQPYQQGYGQPPPPGGGSPNKLSTNQIIAIAAVAVLAIGVLAAIVLVLTGDDGDSGDDVAASGDADVVGAEEVFLEPAASTGEDPFAESVAVDETAVEPEGASPAPSGGNQNTAIQASLGGEPGLFGGTRDNTSCNRQSLVDFLTSSANEDKGQAWADVLGIPYVSIDTYVATLTPITLITDTRVTNHGWRNGEVTVINSVLQSGTAVLVDEYGVPRVRCSCGNPLSEPTPLRAPRYTGEEWRWWNPSTVIVVEQNVTIVDTFVLTDWETGTTFARPAGTDGADDTDDPSTTTPTTDDTPSTSPPISTPPPTRTTPTAPPPTAPPPTEPTGTADDALAIFNGVRNGPCAGVVYPELYYHNGEDISVDDLGGGVFRITVVGYTEIGDQVLVWDVDTATGDLTPRNDLAQYAATVCSAWD